MILSLALVCALVGPSFAAPADSVPAAHLLRPSTARVSMFVPHVAAPAVSFRVGPVRRMETAAPRDSSVSRTSLAPRAVPPEASTSVSSGASADAPQLVDYSDAYFTRLTIHKWASYLTLPLFAGQYAVGRKLLNGDGSDRLRNVHGVLAGSIAGLFAVNTVTGGLNTIEAWKDPDGRTRRTLHTVLMLAADVGFLVTAATAQENENEGGVRTTANNTTHRNVALASMGTAVVGIAVMLPIFGR